MYAQAFLPEMYLRPCVSPDAAQPRHAQEVWQELDGRPSDAASSFDRLAVLSQVEVRQVDAAIPSLLLRGAGSCVGAPAVGHDRGKVGCAHRPLFLAAAWLISMLHPGQSPALGLSWMMIGSVHGVVSPGMRRRCFPPFFWSACVR